ncbi:hypothetical protein BC828DRAFT_416361 [Blastocladiella britannica]|nr:hypothetical protein BC828DRAFT_416361 [Blastocladiella britannica]
MRELQPRATDMGISNTITGPQRQRQRQMAPAMTILVLVLVFLPCATALAAVCSPAASTPCPDSLDRCLRGRCIRDALPCAALAPQCDFGYSCEQGMCLLDADSSSGAMYQRCSTTVSAITDATSSKELTPLGGEDLAPLPAIPTFGNPQSSVLPSSSECKPGFTCVNSMCTSPTGSFQIAAYQSLAAMRREKEAVLARIDSLSRSFSSFPSDPASPWPTPPSLSCAIIRQLMVSADLVHWTPANGTYLTLDDAGPHCCDPPPAVRELAAAAKTLATVPPLAVHGIECTAAGYVRFLALPGRNLSGILDPRLWAPLMRPAGEAVLLGDNPLLTLAPPTTLPNGTFPFAPFSALLRLFSAPNTRIAPGPLPPSSVAPNPATSMPTVSSSSPPAYAFSATWLLSLFASSAAIVNLTATGVSGDLAAAVPWFPHALILAENAGVSGALGTESFNSASLGSTFLDLQGTGACIASWAAVGGSPRRASALASPLGASSSSSDSSGASSLTLSTVTPAGQLVDGSAVTLVPVTTGAQKPLYAICALPSSLARLTWPALVAPAVALGIALLGIVLNREWRARSLLTIVSIVSLVVEVQFVLAASSTVVASSTTSTGGFGTPSSSVADTSISNGDELVGKLTRILLLVSLAIPRVCNAYYTFRAPSTPLVGVRLLAVLDVWHFFLHFRARAAALADRRPAGTVVLAGDPYHDRRALLYIPPTLGAVATVQLVVKELGQLAIALGAWFGGAGHSPAGACLLAVAVVGILKEAGVRVWWVWGPFRVWDRVVTAAAGKPSVNGADSGTGGHRVLERGESLVTVSLTPTPLAGAPTPVPASIVGSAARPTTTSTATATTSPRGGGPVTVETARPPSRPLRTQRPREAPAASGAALLMGDSHSI